MTTHGNNSTGNNSTTSNTPGNTTHGSTATVSQTTQTSQQLFQESQAYVQSQSGRTGTNDQMSGHDLVHQQQGETVVTNPNTLNTRGTGYHHRPGGTDHPDRRTGTPTASDPNTGVYSAPVTYRNPNYDPNAPANDPRSNEWVTKKGNGGESTFFPDSWSAEDVDNATTDAWQGSDGTSRTPTPKPDGSPPDTGTWSGESNGVKVEGWYKIDPTTGDETIGHGWPVL